MGKFGQWGDKPNRHAETTMTPEVERVVKGLIRFRKELQTIAARRAAQEAVMDRNPSGATRTQVKAVAAEMEYDIIKMLSWMSWLAEAKETLEKEHPSTQIDKILPLIKQYFDGCNHIRQSRADNLKLMYSWLDAHK